MASVVATASVVMVRIGSMRGMAAMAKVLVVVHITGVALRVVVETGEELSDRGMVGSLLLRRLSSTVRLALRRRHRLLPHQVLWLLGQGFNKLLLLEELDYLWLEHAAQLILVRLGQPHALKEVVLVTQREFPIRGQLQVHLGVVLRDLDPTVWLALDEEKRKLELLVGVSDRPVDIKGAFLVIEQLVGDLNISLLELGDGDLLLDELQEEFLLVTYPFTIFADILLSFLDDFLGQRELLMLLIMAIHVATVSRELILAGSKMLRRQVLVTRSLHIAVEVIHVVFI